MELNNASRPGRAVSDEELRSLLRVTATRAMRMQIDVKSTLPTDSTAGTLVGRVWRPDLGGPSVVAIRPDGVFDISRSLPTDARSLRVARSGRSGRGRTCGPHRRSRRHPRQHGGRQARSGQAVAACADRPAGREGRGRHLRDLAAGARDRGAGARRAGTRRASARRGRKRAGRQGRGPQARLAAGGRAEEAAAGQGPVVAISRSRHRAGRRDLHQVPGAVRGRHRHVDRRAGLVHLEQSRARGRRRRDLEGQDRRRDARQ